MHLQVLSYIFLVDFQVLKNDNIQYVHEQILIPGDVNRDGIINSLDIIMILSHLNGSIELTDNQFFYADMDADTEITHNDVVLLVNELLLADL